MFFNKLFPICIFIVLIFSQMACTNSKHLSYFPTIADTSIALVNKDFEPTIQSGDILFIAVTSLDPASSALFNSANSLPAQSSMGATNMAQNVTTGFLVNAKGDIEIPKIGKVIARGKTKAELSSFLQESLLPYLKDPVVTIRFMNYRVTVLGEVARPSTVTVSNERVSILEALGLCGDLTMYGNRTNILLIHENNGVKELHRINLNDNSLFSSPYYYLHSNDVLYVEPNKSKAYSSSLTPMVLPSVLGGLSILLVLINILLK